MGNSRNSRGVSKQRRKAKARLAWAKYKERTGQDLSCAMRAGRMLKTAPQRAEKAEKELKATTEKLQAANEDIEASRAARSTAEQSLSLTARKSVEYEQGLRSAQTVARATEAALLAEREQRQAAESAWFAEKHNRHAAEAAWLAEKQLRHAAEAALSAENQRCRQMEAEASATKMVLVALQNRVVTLEKVNAGMLHGMSMAIPPPGMSGFPAHVLQGQVLMPRVNIGSLGKSTGAARDSARGQSSAKRNDQRQVRHC